MKHIILLIINKNQTNSLVVFPEGVTLKILKSIDGNDSHTIFTKYISLISVFQADVSKDFPKKFF